MQPKKLNPDARPARLRALDPSPDDLWIAGPLDDDARVVAIVGSRDCSTDSAKLAGVLAGALAAKGIVVLSGGAAGVDAAAHEGALAASGRTWCVAGTGHRHTYPIGHGALFARIVKSGGAMIWPFPPDASSKIRGNFKRRNGVLVALADAVVIVQAGIPSGTLNAAHWCERLGRPLYVVGVGPRLQEGNDGFEGSRVLLENGARPVASVAGLLVALGLERKRSRRDRRLVHGLARVGDPSARAVSEAVGDAPLHMDEIVVRTGLATSTVSTALLTLVLENVLVEGPSGFYRRQSTAQTLKIPIDIAESSQRHLDG